MPKVNKKKKLNLSELGIFKASQELISDTLKDVDPEGYIREESRLESRAKTVKDITRKEVLTGKKDKSLTRFKEQLVRESVKESVEDQIQFRERENTTKSPSEKEESLTPAQQKLIRLRKGTKGKQRNS